MTLGQKIKKLRNEQGLTQKDLAENVNVTFQTVSKWEKDENEPDVSTLRKLANLFGCSMDYLLSEDEPESEEVEEESTEKEQPQPVSQTIIIHEREPHVCSRCGKDILEDDFEVEHLSRTVHSGRTHRTVSAGDAFYHKECYEQLVKERKEHAEATKATNLAKAKKRSFGWGIAGGIIALGISLAVFFTQTEIHPALIILFSLLIGYSIFAALYCIISGSYIGDVFLWCSSLSIKFPGLIFSWDLEGFAWLIAMKILFAILGFLIGILTLVFGVVMAASLGAISFPFVLIHNIRTDYEDTL